MVTLLLLAAGFVAFTNGANANGKGVASLYGSGTTSLRVALWWGTAATFLGGLTAIFIGQGLMKAFGGRGLVPDTLAQTPDFALAVALGAAITSFLATRLGFPVSTTHALTGALAGAGMAHGWDGVNFGPLGKTFVQPLLLSPILAIALGAGLCALFKLLRVQPRQRTSTLDALHFLSGGAASFARGLNDTPKMAALLLVIPHISPAWAIAGVAVLIALGGLLDSRKVGETLGKKVTGMDANEGFAANVSTALLVCTASLHSLPVSTTHISVGSLLGIGWLNGKGHWGKVGQIALSWLITLPCSGLLAASISLLLSRWR